jgi:hypothetical protein
MNEPQGKKRNQEVLCLRAMICGKEFLRKELIGRHTDVFFLSGRFPSQALG